MTAAPVGPATSRSVSFTIARDPALVRTVRLVAASLARRAGLDAATVEEVRLAVGETFSVMLGGTALGAEGSPGVDGEVSLTLVVGDGLEAEVRGPVPPASALEHDLGDLGDLADLGTDPWALVRGVNEDLAVSDEGDDTVVRLAWRG